MLKTPKFYHFSTQPNLLWIISEKSRIFFSALSQSRSRTFWIRAPTDRRTYIWFDLFFTLEHNCLTSYVSFSLSKAYYTLHGKTVRLSYFARWFWIFKKKSPRIMSTWAFWAKNSFFIPLIKIYFENINISALRDGMSHHFISKT